MLDRAATNHCGSGSSIKFSEAGLWNRYSIQRQPDGAPTDVPCKRTLERFKASALKTDCILRRCLTTNGGAWPTSLTVDALLMDYRSKNAAFFAFRESRRTGFSCSQVRMGVAS